MNTCKGLRLCAAAMVLLELTACSTPKSSVQDQTVDSQIASSAASSETETMSLSDTLELGAKYLSSLNFESAIIQFTAVLDADASNKNALAGLYAAYAASGKTEQANDIFDKAEEILGNDTLFLPYVLDDAGVVSENGGGSDVYRSLADRYLNSMGDEFDESENSLESIGNAWLDADPENPDAYVPLSVYYTRSGNDDKLAELTQMAEENGLDVDTVNASIIEVAGEGYVIKMDAGDLGEIEITVTPETDPEDVSKQATSQAVSNATSDIMEGAGIDPNAPGGDAAQQLINDTLMEGLSALYD